MEELLMFKMKAEEMKMHIEKGKVVSFGRGDYLVSCIRGTLWITWPGSGDVILRDGDDLSVRQQGNICITSMSGAFIVVRRKSILPCVREIPRITAVKLLKSVVSCIKNEESHSAFGDSVHSITR
jgi:hypothetical protein